MSYEMTTEIARFRSRLERTEARVAELEGATTRLVKTSRLLHENCVGCAVDHHHLDFQEQGLPGWLADSEAEIARAEAALATTPAKPETHGDE